MRWLWLVLAFASAASAQDETLGDPSSEDAILDASPAEIVLPAPPPGGLPTSYRTLDWASEPGGPEGILNPVLITHPDYGLMLAGGIVATISYVLGSSISILLGAIGGCSGWVARCEPGLAALGLLPLAEWSAGFSGAGASVWSFIVGGVFAPIELVGLVMLLAGAMHHHPQLVPRETLRRRQRAERARSEPDESQDDR
jgi:hypothetical protein